MGLRWGVGGDSKAENGSHGRQVLFLFSFGLCLMLLLYDVHFWSAFAWVLINTQFFICTKNVVVLRVFLVVRTCPALALLYYRHQQEFISQLIKSEQRPGEDKNPFLGLAPSLTCDRNSKPG